MLSKFGIKVLWAGWRDDPRIGFSSSGYNQWKDKIMVGTRMLIYEAADPRPEYSSPGIKSIMAEVQVTKMFDEVKGQTAPNQEHEHLILVDILRKRDSVPPIPLRRIRALIQNTIFPFQSTYLTLEEDVYNLLLKEWER